ncbi:hypothetical protein FBUS_10868 [Fasciolopsis buskii]|uniref:Uncharacterized protein n=1 Tax=Fasciolopsis buskii TaxID=27845 RepID=A0A8E0S3N9_9TREM|nr:hypothetical protein FBUS_10868 [Fasciolopsis buski]
MRNVVLSPKMTTPAISSVFQTEKFHPSTRTADPRQQALAPFLSSTEMTNGSNSHPAVPKHPSPLRLPVPNPSTAHTALLNKPLPPVPIENQSPDSAQAGSALVTAVDTIAISEANNTEALTSIVTDGSREHKPHKHHKHHKHRHRHKTRDGTTVSSATADSGVSVSADSDRHRETGETLATSLQQSPRGMSVIPALIADRSTEPPPPPPRGSSSLTTCVLDEKRGSDGHLPIARPVGIEPASNVVGISSRPLSETLISLSDLPTVAFPDATNLRNASQSSLVERSKQPSVLGSR